MGPLRRSRPPDPMRIIDSFGRWLFDPMPAWHYWANGASLTEIKTGQPPQVNNSLQQLEKGGTKAKEALPVTSPKASPTAEASAGESTTLERLQTDEASLEAALAEARAEAARTVAEARSSAEQVAAEARRALDAQVSALREEVAKEVTRLESEATERAAARAAALRVRAAENQEKAIAFAIERIAGGEP